MSVFIIAEAASCHEGDYNRAKDLIRVARESGADAVKFQYWSYPERMAERRHVDAERYKTGSIRSFWFSPLYHEAAKNNIEFMCTVYLPEDIGFVDQYVSRHKISSFESNDPSFVREVSERGKETIISTGMMNLAECRNIPWGTHHKYLHCTSAYPTPIEEANLGCIEGMDGYSDHTRCPMTGAFAVSAGAKILEVHFCLNDTVETCPDRIVSHRPEMLRAYIYYARMADEMRGSGVKLTQASERDNRRYRVK